MPEELQLSDYKSFTLACIALKGMLKVKYYTNT